jgi:hypothetical protein
MNRGEHTRVVRTGDRHMTMRSFAIPFLFTLLLGVSGASATPPDDAARRLGEHVEHGSTYYAVYVAVAPTWTSELEETARVLVERGVRISRGGIDCDRRPDGTPPIASAPEEAHMVAAYFTRRRDAVRFARTLPRPPAGIVRVTIYCAD